MIADLLGAAGVTIAWFSAIGVVLIAIVLAGVAIRYHRPRLGLAALVPVGMGALAGAFGLDVPAPDPAYAAALATTLAALGILAGNPITVFVLGVAKSPDPGADASEHGGIIVPAEKGERGKREVLRGGWVIGYLERLAIIGAVALGRFEIVAAVVAIKGLGRFTELDNSAARERFIIGTLTSMLWAGACALLILFVRR
jgi:hypothetical protein